MHKFAYLIRAVYMLQAFSNMKFLLVSRILMSAFNFITTDKLKMLELF